MIDTILWDVDDTLLNFHESEGWAIKECLRLNGMKEINDASLEQYRQINHEYWKKLERGEVQKKDLLVWRFRDFFEQQGIQGEPESFNEMYQSKLGDKVFPNDDAVKLCRKLKTGYKQYAVSNGTKTAQYRKLRLSELDQIFDGLFISEEVGYEKPNEKFFDEVFSKIGEEKRASSVIIGDSLTSDMLGGNRANIKCMWYNPKGMNNDKGVHTDYEITNLWELETYLENEENYICH